MAKKTIIFVDDMTAILEHAKQILKEDYNVIPCTGASQALDIASKRRPDLFITDINMPDTDGYELLKKVRGSAELSDIPVILVTSEITADIENKGFEMGADDFLLKPFSQTSMLKRISMQMKLHEKK